jgi:hypothetical protein
MSAGANFSDEDKFNLSLLSNLSKSSMDASKKLESLQFQ